MEITRQADYYGLDAPDRDPAPPPEKVAEQLAPPVPWSGPMKRADQNPHPPSTVPGSAGPINPPQWGGPESSEQGALESQEREGM